MNLNNVWDDVQSILVQSIKELFLRYTELSSLGVFVAVPKGALVPYIKIGSARGQSQQLFNDNSFTGEFELTAFSASKNDTEVTNALNCVYSQLPDYILGRSRNGVSVVNVIPGNIVLEEDLDIRAWRGTLPLLAIASS